MEVFVKTGQFRVSGVTNLEDLQSALDQFQQDVYQQVQELRRIDEEKDATISALTERVAELEQRG